MKKEGNGTTGAVGNGRNSTNGKTIKGENSANTNGHSGDDGRTCLECRRYGDKHLV